jgi:hypothetical protein
MLPFSLKKKLNDETLEQILLNLCDRSNVISKEIHMLEAALLTFEDPISTLLEVGTLNSRLAKLKETDQVLSLQIKELAERVLAAYMAKLMKRISRN